MMTKNQQKVIDQRYIREGKVKSPTSLFLVRKGKDNPLMVYHGTMNRFNDRVGILKFCMPTLKSYLRAMMLG